MENGEWRMKDYKYIPEGYLIIAQGFIPGKQGRKKIKSPVGTDESIINS
jgi:hypothetical protein